MSADTPKILVAEDNYVMANILRFNLERTGFEVRVASSGTEAAELLQQNQFDMLLSDYQMPGLSGEELCRRVREDQRHARMPVVLISAKGYELDTDRLSKELSLAKVLFKPFSPKEVISLVQSVLGPMPA
jgi:CheY-like chemotaxis protein